MDNLEQMDKFLESCNLPKLFQEEIKNMNISITSTEIETVIKTFQQRPGPDGFTRELYDAFKEELTCTLLKLFPKAADEGILPSSFYEVTITLIPKSDTDTTKKENHR